ncbi:hypothetical protein ACTXT7_007689 [Hymenolepis weldensis]
MEKNWPPNARENSIFTALLTHSEDLSLREECMAWHGMMDKSPGKSMRHLTKDLQVSEGTIRDVVHQNFEYKGEVRPRALRQAALDRRRSQWTKTPYVFQQESALFHKALKT